MIKQSHLYTKGLVSFTLFLGTMGKGHAWISSRGVTHSVGRYWDIQSEHTECPNCDWAGSFFATKCPVDCQKPSQSYYHIPSDWILGENFSPSTLEIILLEEKGGDPTGVQLVLLN